MCFCQNLGDSPVLGLENQGGMSINHSSHVLIMAHVGKLWRFFLKEIFEIFEMRWNKSLQNKLQLAFQNEICSLKIAPSVAIQPGDHARQDMTIYDPQDP